MKRHLCGPIIALILIIAACLASPAAAAVAAAPELPIGFYGEITLNDSPAPVGTSVEARGDNVKRGIDGNPLVTTAKGYYGDESGFGAKLIVEGDSGPIAAGTVISFYINGHKANETFSWPEDAQDILEQQLDLSVSYSSSGGGGGGGTSGTTTSTTTPAATTTQPAATTTVPAGTRVFNLAALTDASGRFTDDFYGTSEDGSAHIFIPAGTIATDAEGNPLTEITLRRVANPDSSSQAGFMVIGDCYDFQPDGAQFSSPVTLTLTYVADQLPDGEVPYLAFWNTRTPGWEKLDTTALDEAAHTISASVSHFTVFAVLADRPSGTSVPLTTTATATVTTTATVTSAATVSSPAGTTGAVPPDSTAEGGIPGWVIGLIIAVVVIAAGVVVVVSRRSKK